VVVTAITDGSDLGQALAALAAAQTVEAALVVVRRHPVLLEAAFHEEILAMMHQADSPEAAETVLRMLAMVDAVRAAIAAAAARADSLEVDGDSLDLVADLLASLTPDQAAAAVTAFPEAERALPGAAALLHGMLADVDSRGDGIARSRYFTAWAFARDCVDFGIPEAAALATRYRPILQSLESALVASVDDGPAPHLPPGIQPVVEEAADDPAVDGLHARALIRVLSGVPPIGRAMEETVRTGKADELANAVEPLEQVIALLPEGHPCALLVKAVRAKARICLYVSGADRALLRAGAVELCEVALHPAIAWGPYAETVAQAAMSAAWRCLAEPTEVDLAGSIGAVPVEEANDSDRLTELHGSVMRRLLAPAGGESESEAVIVGSSQAFALGQEGNELLSRYAERGDPDVLHQAIAVLARAARLDGLASMAGGIVHDLLGWAYRQKYAATGDRSLLDRGIALAEAAQRVPISIPGLPPRISATNLANMLVDRQQLASDSADGDRAIDLLEDDLRLHPDDSDDDAWATRSALGIALIRRYERTGDIAALEHGIDLAERAAQRSRAPGPLTNLAFTLLAQADHSDEHTASELRSRAIALLETACAHQEPTDPAAASRWGGLAQALIVQGMAGRRRIDRLFGLAIHAAGPTSEFGMRMRASHAQYLAEWARRPGLPFRRRRAAQTALRIATDVLASTPDDHTERPLNLFVRAVALARRAPDRVDAEEISQTYRQACEGAHKSLSTIGRFASRWMEWAADQEAWAEVGEAADVALSAIYRLSLVQAVTDHKDLWVGSAADLAQTASFAHTLAGDPAAAVVSIEAGRAIVLSERVALSPAQIDLLPDGTKSGLLAAFASWAGTSRRLEQARHDMETPPALMRDVAAAWAGLESAIRDVRRIAGFHRFWDIPAFDDIAATASATAPVVYLIPGEGEGLALMVDSGARAVWLPGLGRQEVEPAVALWAKGTPWHEDVQRWAWTGILGPVLSELSDARELTLIPCGQLALLPLHLARPPDTTDYLLDRIAIRYAPNARVLRRAPLNPWPDHLKAVIIADPQPTSRRRLPATLLEGGRIADLYTSALLLTGAEASRATVEAAIAEGDVLHLACHGETDLNQPLNSALLLADDTPLDLAHLLRLPVAAAVVVLSACGTAVPGQRIPDEAIGLNTGFLAAGAHSVIGTLWPVDDVAAMMISIRWHQLHQAGIAPAEALRQAQIWLREGTNHDKAITLGIPRPELRGLAARLWGTGRAHADPSTWGAFVYSGP
jgi:hypothetical protein